MYNMYYIYYIDYIDCNCILLYNIYIFFYATRTSSKSFVLFLAIFEGILEATT